MNRTPLLLALLLLILAPRLAQTQIQTLLPRQQPALGETRVPPPPPPVGVVGLRNPADNDTTQRAASPPTAPGDRPNLKPIQLAAEFLLRAEDISAGNFIAPLLNGHYTERLFGVATDPVRGTWFVNIGIQAPSTARDSAAFLNRLLASGGTGNISVGTRAGMYAAENVRGIVGSLQGGVSLVNEQQLANGTIPQLGFATARFTAAGWAGPLAAFTEISGNRIFSGKGPEANALPGEEGPVGGTSLHSAFERPVSILAGFAVRLSLLGQPDAPQFLSVRYLVPTGGVAQTNNLEVRFVQTLDHLFR